MSLEKEEVEGKTMDKLESEALEQQKDADKNERESWERSPKMHGIK